MRDRLLTLALAAAALFAFYALFIPRSTPQELMTRPTSNESGPNGYVALARWLDGQGVETVSFRDRFNKLGEVTEPVQPAGNLLLSTAPHFYAMRASETVPLQDWIGAGNTLLMVVGLSDTPEWSMNSGRDPRIFQNLEAMTGLHFRMVRDTSGEKVQQSDQKAFQSVEEIMTSPPDKGDEAEQPGELPPSAPTEKSGTEDDPAEALRKARTAVDRFMRLLEPQRFELRPSGAHPLLTNVGSVETLSEYPTAKYEAFGQDLFLELAREADSDVPVLWLRPYGEGQIIVLGYGNAFTNKLIGKADNRRLLANIVASSVHGQGRVLIDDAHQGLVAFYDPEKFYGDVRLHRTLWWLLGLWLVFVVGSTRLRAGTSRWSPLDVTTFVRATGGFMARVLTPATAGKRLIQNFLDDVRRRTGLTGNDEHVWEWLRVHANVGEPDIEQLRQVHERARGRRIDLPRLQTLLAQVRASIK